MKPGGGGALPAALEDALKSSFGSVDAFKAQFKDAAVAQFGSGWAWLVHDANDKLKIVKTPNAENPLCYGQAALLTCDVWEHAYCARCSYLSRYLVRTNALRPPLQTWTIRTGAATLCRRFWTTLSRGISSRAT